MDISAKFDDFEALTKTFERYQKDNYSSYRIRTSELVTKSNLKTKRQAPEACKYSRCRFVCTHYGKPRLRGSGIIRLKRDSTEIWATECKSFVHVVYDYNEKKLIIKDAMLEHNHPTTAETYDRERMILGRRRKKLREGWVFTPNTCVSEEISSDMEQPEEISSDMEQPTLKRKTIQQDDFVFTPTTSTTTVPEEISRDREQPAPKRTTMQQQDDGRLLLASCQKRTEARPNAAETETRRLKDGFDSFGQTVAKDLRTMSKEQYIHAKKLISDVLYEGHLDSLSRSSRVLTGSAIFPRPQNPHHSLYPTSEFE